ncbi:MAG: DUF1554 domain-containing protein, partial [Leptospiraceae bacterium]|nr:DUF1554 domain-containing protein [Leptospiraceae bacterium]
KLAFLISFLGIFIILGCKSEKNDKNKELLFWYLALTANSTTTSTSTYSIGGTISGLTSSGLVLQNNSTDDLSIDSGSTSFTFSTKTTTYDVTVSTQPSDLNCTVSDGSGTATTDITSVSITCSSTSNNSSSTTSTTKKMYLTTTSYNGNLGGISGADTKCQSEYSGTKALVVGTSRRACTTSNCTNSSEENVPISVRV